MYLDDDLPCLDVFAETFGADYEVVTARTDAEARRALDERNFDIVISDQFMPGADGIAFLRWVAQARPASYRILLTGGTHVGALLQEMTSGVINLFATKPWTESSMREKLERAQVARPRRARPTRAA